MKRILIWVALLLMAGSVWGYDWATATKGKKITPIKGIIIVCSGQANTEECEEAYLGYLFNNSPIKIVTRQHLKAIFEEKSLQMSGLTEKEKSQELGKLLGASHILLYKKISDEWGISMDYTLININSSEIEYYFRARDLHTIKTKQKVSTSADFFDMLNRHVAK
jgi:hypothetical protein